MPDKPRPLSRLAVNRRQVLPLLALVFIAAGLVWMSYPALAGVFTPETERYRREGDLFLLDGRLPEAVLAYRQAVQADDANEAALLSLAEAYRQQGRLRMAARYRQQLARTNESAQPNLMDVSIPESLPGWLEYAWMTGISESTPVGGLIQDRYFIGTFEDGVVVALNSTDGKERWRSKIATTVLSAPASDGKSVWVGDADGQIFALAWQDGSVRWQYKTGSPLYAAPAMDEQRVYVPCSDGTLYALNKENGSLLWKFTTQGGLHGEPALEAGVVYFGSMDGKLYAVEAATGAPVWRDGILTGGAIESRPVVSAGRVVFGSGDGRVYSLEPSTGGQYWRVSTPDAIYARVLTVEDSIYAASSGASLLAVNFETGEKLWQTEFQSPLRNPPAVSGDYLYLVTDGDPYLYKIDLNSGSVTGNLHTGDWITVGPWIADQMLYLLGKDGTAIAYRLTD